MGYKGNSAQGEIPESGAIFMSNVKTHKECLERKLFGLPSGMSDFVLLVKEGMTLFLFEFERRLLYGVFRATCDGEINIDPKAFRSSGKQFPAQVRFTTVYECSPLAENEFKDVISGNYFSGKKFNFGLNKKQVSKLMKLFRSKLISRDHSERNIWRYDDDSSEGNTRSRDLRNDIRHRLRFDSCDSRVDEDKKADDDDMYINKHIIESRHDEFGYCSRQDILGKRKHLDFKETNIEDGYMPVSNKPYGTNLDEIDVRNSEFLMDGVNKDIIDHQRLQDEYNIREGLRGSPSEYPLTNYGENKDMIDYKRLQDEYNIRESLRGSINEYPLTNHGLSYLNQNDYSNCDVPDIHLSPRFDDVSGFILIANNHPVYPSPEKLSMSRSLPYYSDDDVSNRYLDDPGLRSSIYPDYISRNLSSPDPGLRVGEADPAYSKKRFYEKHESKHRFADSDKRVSVFSRLTMNLRHEEHGFESDDKHELNSSVDKVMKMLEKVVSSPKKRSGKNVSVYKQDDADNSPDNKIEVHEFSDMNFEVDADADADADVADEEVKGESVFQETRLVDFMRRKKSNRKENSECLVGATSGAGPGTVANDELTGMPPKRRKLIRPAFVEKNIIPDNVNAHENTKDNSDVVLESLEKVDDVIKPMLPTCHENTPDDSYSTKVESRKLVRPAFVENNIIPDSINAHENSNDNSDVVLESLEKVDDIIKPMLPTCHENTPDDSYSTKVESRKLVRPAFVKKNIIPDSINAHENSNDNSDVDLESIEKVDDIIKPMVPTCHENTLDDSNSTEVETESSKRVDVSIKHIDLNMMPTSDDDNNLTKVVTESQKSGNEGDENVESRVVSGAFAEGTGPKDDQKTCGWIEW